MQDQPLDRTKPQRFRFRPIPVAITGVVVIFTLVCASIAIAYRPLMARFYYSAGYTWNQRKDFDKAIADYDEAIRLDPGYADAYFARGYAWNEKKQLDKAITDYSAAIRLDPGNANAYINRGSLYKMKAELYKAIADFSEAIRLSPSEPEVHLNRGSLWAEKKVHRKAIADYNQAIRLNPNDANVYKNRGYAWSELQDHDKALADYTEAIRLEPTDAWTHFSVAWILTYSSDERIRDGKRAVESATKACELSEWKEPTYLQMLAAACAESGDFNSAVKWQTRANALHSDPKVKAQGETSLKRYQDANTAS